MIELFFHTSTLTSLQNSKAMRAWFYSTLFFVLCFTFFLMKKKILLVKCSIFRHSKKREKKRFCWIFFSYLLCLCYINNVYLDPIQVSMNSDCYWADDLFFFCNKKKIVWNSVVALLNWVSVYVCVCVLLLIFIRCICMISCSCSVYTILWIRILNKTIYKSVCVCVL